MQLSLSPPFRLFSPPLAPYCTESERSETHGWVDGTSGEVCYCTAMQFLDLVTTVTPSGVASCANKFKPSPRSDLSLMHVMTSGWMMRDRNQMGSNIHIRTLIHTSVPVQYSTACKIQYIQETHTHSLSPHFNGGLEVCFPTRDPFPRSDQWGEWIE